MRTAVFGLCGLIGLLVASPAWAQGINTNVALPVARGEAIWRSQLRFVRATDDPSPADREVSTLVAPQTLVLGVTPRLTAFATLPLLAHRRVASSSGTTRIDAAFGDVTLLGRYTLWWDDYAPLSTRRVALLGGVKLPTGADRFGTRSLDPMFGAVATWAFDRHEVDLDAIYRVSTQRRGFRQGDGVRYDAAYRYRLWPAHFRGTQWQLNALVELNGEWRDRDRKSGASVRSSGGSKLFVAPGLQLISKRWILETSFQVPIVQDLKGTQLEQDFVAVLSFRVPFALP
ncbi:MAG: hypothetical protein ACE5IL_13945 [Myxococcota bacterium]